MVHQNARKQVPEKKHSCHSHQLSRKVHFQQWLKRKKNLCILSKLAKCIPFHAGSKKIFLTTQLPKSATYTLELLSEERPCGNENDACKTGPSMRGLPISLTTTSSLIR